MSENSVLCLRIGNNPYAKNGKNNSARVMYTVSEALQKKNRFDWQQFKNIHAHIKYTQ
jgi:hypothetical protein